MSKKGKTCGVCASDKRGAIEIGLVHGVSLKALGDRYGFSKDAIGRHARNHLPPHVRAGIMAAQQPEGIDVEKLRQTESEGLLGHLVTQRARLLQISRIALDAGDVRTMVAAEGGIGANLALEAKLLGQLVTRMDVRHSSVLLTPDYLRARQVLMGALRQFPEAARAVAAALHALESDAAKDISGPPVIEHEPAALPAPPY